MFEIDEITVECPRAEFHVTVLYVKRIVFDVYCAIALVDHRWFPDDFAIVLNCCFCFRCYLIVTLSACVCLFFVKNLLLIHLKNL